MKNKKQDKQIKNLLFEVYEKGVKQQDCNLTEYIEKVKQALRIHDVVGQSEQLKAFSDYAQKRMWEDGDKDLSEFVDEFLSL